MIRNHNSAKIRSDGDVRLGTVSRNPSPKRAKAAERRRHQRMTKFYREQIDGLGRVSKIILVYEGGKYDGRFTSVEQLSKCGDIKVYGDNNRVIRGIIVWSNGEFHPIEEGRIKISVPVIVGNKDMPGTQETGLILFDDREERCALTKYFSDNKGVWVEESNLKLVTALTHQRKRKNPNRDLEVHQERDKYLRELGPINLTRASAKKLQYIYWFFLSHPYAGELSYSQPYYVINNHILEGRYMHAFQIMLRDYNMWQKFEQLDLGRFVREREDGSTIEAAEDPSHPIHIPDVSVTYDPRVHPEGGKMMATHQVVLQYTAFHVGLNWEIMTDRRRGFVKELADVGCKQSFLEMVESSAVAARNAEMDSKDRKPPAEKKKSICIQCNARESRARNARCHHCIQGKQDRCISCGVRKKRTKGCLCVTCFIEKHGDQREKCTRCKVNLPNRKGGLCLKCSKLPAEGVTLTESTTE